MPDHDLAGTLCRLSPDQYPRVRGLFDPLRYHLVIDSMIDGNTPAWAFADDAARPRTALLWDRQDALFVAGAAPPAGVAALAAVLTAEVFSDARRRGVPGMSIAYTPDAWDPHLPSLIGSLRGHFAMRRYYRFDRPRVAWRAAIPAGCRVLPIDAALLAGDTRENADQVRGWVRSFWHSDQAFAQTGFGYCLLDGDVIASWCLSVFASQRQIELGLATAPAYRNRGYATVTAAACVDHAVTAGLTPHWHCWEDNHPSRAVAEKVGFVAPTGYTQYQFDL